MKRRSFTHLFSTATNTQRRYPRRWFALERMEDRLAPAANILVSANGTSSQQLFKEFTPSGALVRSVVIPAAGAVEDARDLVADASGNVLVYNGTFDPYLSTVSSGGTWTHSTHSGWSTVNNGSYGGIGLWNNYAFATDMTTYGETADEAKGIVRFNLTDGTTSRFATTYEPIDLTVGRDGLLYGLDPFRTINVYDPSTLGLVRTLTLPMSINGASQFYSGLAVNAAGEIYIATSSNKMVHKFSAAGVVLNSATLAGPGGSPTFGWLSDIDVSDSGRLLIGTTSGHVAQMNDNFTDVSYILAATSGTVFVAFGADTGAPLPVSVTINDATVTEGNSGTTPAVFTVSLSASSTQTITLSYATASSTALTNSDFQSASGTLTFNPGETSKTITVNVNGDVTMEQNEVFFVNLSNLVNATTADGQGTGTITNDDATTLNINDVTLAEGKSGTTNFNFTVTLAKAESKTVTVNYATADGTATAGSDYTAASGTLTFSPGETSKTITVAVVGEATIESNETFTVTLSGATNATIADGQGLGTITDDDKPTISINDVTMNEGNSGSASAVFTVSLSWSSAQTVTVNYATATGSATSGTDFTSASGTLTFAPGETSKTVSVSVLGDQIDEANELFYLDLSGATNATIADSTGLGNITDDDTSNVTVNDVSVNEGNTGSVASTFTVTLSTPNSKSVTVSWSTAAGTAMAGSDYTTTSGNVTFSAGETSKTLTVSVLGDTLAEANETYFVNLTSATNATITDNQGVGTIVDNDGLPTLAISDVTVTEGNSSAAQVNFTVTLSATSTQTVTVNYATANGTANGGDYYLTFAGNSLSFSPGQTSKSITVSIVGDVVDELNETFFINLSNAVNATIADSQGLGTINDNDTSSLYIYDASPVNENNSGTVSTLFTVSMAITSDRPVSVTWATANGTATAGSDYNAASGTLTFNPGETSKSGGIL